MGCDICGTSTGTHWDTCPYSAMYVGRASPGVPLARRTESERKAYVAGMEKGIELSQKHGFTTAKVMLDTIKEAM